MQAWLWCKHDCDQVQWTSTPAPISVPSADGAGASLSLHHGGHHHSSEPGRLHPICHQVSVVFCGMPTSLFILVCVCVCVRVRVCSFTSSACCTRKPGCLHPLGHQVSVACCDAPSSLFVLVCVLYFLTVKGCLAAFIPYIIKWVSHYVTCLLPSLSLCGFFISSAHDTGVLLAAFIPYVIKWEWHFVTCLLLSLSLRVCSFFSHFFMIQFLFLLHHLPESGWIYSFWPAFKNCACCLCL